MQQKRSESEDRLRHLAYLPTDDALSSLVTKRESDDVTMGLHDADKTRAPGWQAADGSKGIERNWQLWICKHPEPLKSFKTKTV